MQKINIKSFVKSQDEFELKISKYPSSDLKILLMQSTNQFEHIKHEFHEMNRDVINQIIEEIKYRKGREDSLPYNEQIFEMFDYDINKVHQLLTHTMLNEPDFYRVINEQADLKGIDKSNLNNLIVCLLVNPFIICYKDHSLRKLHSFFHIRRIA